MNDEDRKRIIGEMIDKASQRVESHGPPCSECKWAQWPDPGDNFISECQNPVYRLNGLGVGSGVGNKGPILSIARSDNGLCGPKAVLFEPPNLAVGFFTRLFRK